MKSSFLSKLVVLFSKDRKTVFDISANEQAKFLEKLGDSKDDIDRSFKQYRCHLFFEPKWKRILLWIVAAFSFPFVLIFLLMKGIRKPTIESVEAVAVFNGVPEVIPEELYNSYSIKNDCTFENFSLRFPDLGFIGRFLFRYLAHPFFVLKSALNVAKYSFLINKYQPKCIIVHTEFSFSCSLLTDYCHTKNVKHIDVMHGEKLYFIRDSFFHYDECYVWDYYYIKLFMSLKAEPNQFKIAIPKSLVIDTVCYFDDVLYADYKYYLVKCSEEELRSIIQSMSFANKNGRTVKFRPHPRWTDISLLERYLPKEAIEYPESVSIMQSVANLSYAVGSYTTVLNQAAHSGKGVVLDDVTYKEQYDKLKELKYYLANKNYPKLSDFQ